MSRCSKIQAIFIFVSEVSICPARLLLFFGTVCSNSLYSAPSSSPCTLLAICIPKCISMQSLNMIFVATVHTRM
ncbi:hypothetical protein RSAG8_06692, partial [Rhizoctonia solani AG-8 WAC10335]